MGKEAPTRVWRSLKVNLRCLDCIYPREKREPLKTLKQWSDPIRPRFTVLPQGRVEVGGMPEAMVRLSPKRQTVGAAISIKGNDPSRLRGHSGHEWWGARR